MSPSIVEACVGSKFVGRVGKELAIYLGVLCRGHQYIGLTWFDRIVLRQTTWEITWAYKLQLLYSVARCVRTWNSQYCLLAVVVGSSARRLCRPLGGQK